MSGRRLTALDIQEAKRAEEIYNSQVNRGDIDISNRGSTRHVVCGCGVEGCIFISTQSRQSESSRSAHEELVARKLAQRLEARKTMTEQQLAEDMGF